MGFLGKTVVVTGGAKGIGAALVAAFESSGARVAVFDLASSDHANHVLCDVSKETDLKDAIDWVQGEIGPIDIFVSNAGVMSGPSETVASASDDNWSRCWSVNVMAHVFAARILLPAMIERKSGYFVNVASAAGLLNQIGDAAYSATKQAAVSFAESLAITHRNDGIGVSLVCPQYVATEMIGLEIDAAADNSSLLTADQVAACVLEAVQNEDFLVLPHSAVRRFVQRRAEDHDRWIKGMIGLRCHAIEVFGEVRPEYFYRLV
ncbi:MAG: SDR family NAD(P)-dependent oxidoreductase [Roseobacter sp.]